MRQPSDRILQCSTYLDVWDYPDPGDGRGYALWLTAAADGPIEEPACDVTAVCAELGLDSSPDMCSRERLILESKQDYTEDEVYALIDQVHQRGHIQLSMYEKLMFSDVLDASSVGRASGEINGPDLEVTIRSDDFRIGVELDYEAAGWIDTGLDVFKKRLFNEQALTHLEQRQWLLYTILAPDVKTIVMRQINAALARITQPDLGRWLAPRGEWDYVSVVGASHRERLLHLLRDPRHAFVKENLRMIFADESGFLDAQGNPEYSPAKESTIDKLLAYAGVTPEATQRRYSSRQVLQLVAVACSRERSQKRYHELYTYLTDDLGISVPHLPA